MEEIYNQIKIHKEKINELTNRLKNSTNIADDLIINKEIKLEQNFIESLYNIYNKNTSNVEISTTVNKTNELKNKTRKTKNISKILKKNNDKIKRSKSYINKNKKEDIITLNISIIESLDDIEINYNIDNGEENNLENELENDEPIDYKTSSLFERLILSNKGIIYKDLIMKLKKNNISHKRDISILDKEDGIIDYDIPDKKKFKYPKD